MKPSWTEIYGRKSKSVCEIAPIGFKVPISLFADMTETSTVLSVNAAAIDSADVMPFESALQFEGGLARDRRAYVETHDLRSDRGTERSKFDHVVPVSTWPPNS